jgi:hypothetical protein
MERLFILKSALLGGGDPNCVLPSCKVSRCESKCGGCTVEVRRLLLPRPKTASGVQNPPSRIQCHWGCCWPWPGIAWHSYCSYIPWACLGQAGDSQVPLGSLRCAWRAARMGGAMQHTMHMRQAMVFGSSAGPAAVVQLHYTMGNACARWGPCGGLAAPTGVDKGIGGGPMLRWRAPHQHRVCIAVAAVARRRGRKRSK